MELHSATRQPTVTVILPTLNERRWVIDCLRTVLEQRYPAIGQILVVDGGSTDGTRQLVESLPAPVELVDNPGVTAAAAMNVGIAAAKGEVVCRGDAHTLYAPDYVERCVAVLLETGATNVGGPMRPVGTTNFGRAVAAVTSSPFGVGPGRFHYATERQAVDTVYLGCWWADELRRHGGYDDRVLQWAAEDQELNFRLRRAGGTVVLDPSISSYYFPRETPRALWRQYFNYGVAKASTLAKHRTLPTWRPLAPAALVGGTVVGAIAGRGMWRVAVPLAHAALCGVIGVSVSREPGVAPHRAAAVTGICHWSYGLGFWSGIWRIIRGRGFDVRPSGHR